jgi:hypothetical protein
MFSVRMTEQVLHPYKTTGKIIIFCILIENKRLGKEQQQSLPELKIITPLTCLT